MKYFKYYFISSYVLFLFFFTLNVSANFSGLEGAKKANRDAMFIWALRAYPNTLNPAFISTTIEYTITDGIFDKIIMQDPDNGEFKCMICESMTFSKDKKSVTLVLRKNMKFHDGQPVTAKDVQFTLDAYMHPLVDNLNMKASLISNIHSVKTLSPYRIKINFNSSKFLNLSSLFVGIMPHHRFSYFKKTPLKFNKDVSFSRRPVGSGPYRFKKWLPGKYVEVERFDEWWGFKDSRFKNTFNFKKIRYKVVTDDNVRLQAFKKGEFDYIILYPHQFKNLQESLTKTLSQKIRIEQLRPKINTGFRFIAWNGRLSKFKGVKTREALTLLTNRPAVLNKFAHGLQPATNGPFGKDTKLSCPESKCPVIEFNPKKAKNLLKEDGWKDSDGDGILDRTRGGKKEKLSFTILSRQSDYSKNVFGVFITEMKKAGIDARLKQLDWTAMMKLVDDLKFEAYYGGFSTPYPVEPRHLWHSSNVGKSGSNTWYFVNPYADKIIDQYESEFNIKKRNHWAQKLHHLIYKNHPATFLQESGGCFVGFSQSLKGTKVADYDYNCVYWPRWYKL